MNKVDIKKGLTYGVQLGMRYFFHKLIERLNKEREKGGNTVNINLVLDYLHELLKKGPCDELFQDMKILMGKKQLYKNENITIN